VAGSDWLPAATPLDLAVAPCNSFESESYIAAQMFGEFAGAVLEWLHFLPHWVRTQGPIGELTCFCSHPAIPNRAATGSVKLLRQS
jgi:glycerol uptake facilitator protein